MWIRSWILWIWSVIWSIDSGFAELGKGIDEVRAKKMAKKRVFFGPWKDLYKTPGDEGDMNFLEIPCLKNFQMAIYTIFKWSTPQIDGLQFGILTV